MSLSMHFFTVPNEVFTSRGYTSPRLEDAKFLECIISQKVAGHLQSAWGIHIWLLNDQKPMPRRGDPFRLSREDLERLKAKLEAAMEAAQIVPADAGEEPNNVLLYKKSWTANNPAGLKQAFPYQFDNIVAGDVGHGLEIVNSILENTDFDKEQIWYYPLY